MASPVIDVSIIIPICGDLDYWRSLAERARESALAQTRSMPVYVVEGDTVAAARNQGAADADSEYLVMLDADDELDPFYVERMLEAAIPGVDALYQPATLGIVDGVQDPFPVVIPSKPLLDGNFMVIGTMLRREQFLRVGGFDPTLECVEDWDLYIRCWLDGALFVPVPDAIYRVHVRPGGRNNVDRETAVRLFNTVRNRYINMVPKSGVV